MSFAMPTQVIPNLHEWAFLPLRNTLEKSLKVMRLGAAVKGYAPELISQRKATEPAGVSKAKFVSARSRYRVSRFQETQEHLEHMADSIREVRI